MPRYCTALLKDGRRGDYRTLPGQAFCSGHSDRTYLYRRCQYFNRMGDPCRATPLRGQDHCFTHSPRNKRAKDAAIPLVPRTRRQKERARWFVFSRLPLFPKTGLQALLNQQLGTVPLHRRAGSLVTAK